MFKEFAVDPKTIASSFENCRFFISQFGADKGRLISKFPNNWKRRAIEAADELPDGRKKEKVVEYLNGVGRDWLTLISSHRTYVAPGDTWLSNAIAAHMEKPFAAIVCDRDDPERQLINAETCGPDEPLFSAKSTGKVGRTADELASAAAPLLQNCRKLRFADPYFDPGRPKWRDALAAMLAYIPDIRRVSCEYHIYEREDSPSTDELKRRLQNLRGVIPDGGSVRIVRWRQLDDGERLHRRYILSEDAGLYFEGGLDVEVGGNQSTDVYLLNREHHAERWGEYDLNASVYELVRPVLEVDSEGRVTEPNL